MLSFAAQHQHAAAATSVRTNLCSHQIGLSISLLSDASSAANSKLESLSETGMVLSGWKLLLLLGTRAVSHHSDVTVHMLSMKAIISQHSCTAVEGEVITRSSQNMCTAEP